MDTRINPRGRRGLLCRARLGVVCVAVLTAIVVAACGTSGGDPASSGGNVQSILQQTFSSGHTVKSGVLNLAVSANPSGSSTLTTPITLSLSGPFQSRGSGKLPESDFTVAISALGRSGQLGVLSTGSAGYITLQGNAYQLPQSQFQQLESGLSSVGSGGGAGLSSLGISAQHWLVGPQVVGTETVAGASTTHIHAGLNVPALLSDLNTFLAKTSKSTSGKVPSSISAATQQKIASEVKNATVDIWTGSTDRNLRKLTVALTLPVTGQTSTELGGVTSAGLSLSLQYSDLNQPQTVTAPSHVLPYSQFETKLRGVLGSVEGGLGGSSSSGSSSSSSSSGSGASSGTATTPSSKNVDKYSQCIQAAKGNIAKMQKCAPLLNGQ